MIVGHNIFFINNLLYPYYLLFFSLDGKEPKDQDCQKKSEKSTVRVTEILKLTRTQYQHRLKMFGMVLSARSNSQNFGRDAHRNFD